jgi:hypothetical protein
VLLAEELLSRKASVEEYFQAAAYSGIDDVQANLHYLDYRRFRAEGDKQAREKAIRSLGPYLAIVLPDHCFIRAVHSALAVVGQKKDELARLARPYPTVTNALQAYAACRKLGKVPPVLPRSRKIATAADLGAEIDEMCLALKSYPGEIYFDLPFYVVAGHAGMFKEAIEQGLALDVLDLSVQLTKAAKYLVHEKDVTTFIYVNLPPAASIAPTKRPFLTRIVDQIEEQYSGSIEEHARAMGFGPEGFVDSYNREEKAEDLKRLFQRLHGALWLGDVKTSTALMAGLRPDQQRLWKALREGVTAEMVAECAAFQKNMATPMELQQLYVNSIPSDIRVYAATTEELQGSVEGSKTHEFPAELRELAKRFLRPGMKFYEVEVGFEKGKKGWKTPLLFWDGKQWTMLGPISPQLIMGIDK